MTLNVNLEFKWCDYFLRWNTSEHACFRQNHSEIFFNAYEIWTPDIIVINGPALIQKESKLEYPVSVLCTGVVRWSYKEKLVSFCEINPLNFPFDHQYCSFVLQSSIYDSSQLKLRSLYNFVRLYGYIKTEWEIAHLRIKEIDLYNPNHKRWFSTLQIDIELVRLSRFYILKFILPSCIISSLAVFSFCLPTDSGERITLTVAVSLSLTIYLQLISKYVPKGERSICTLTLYTNAIFLLVVLSCIFNTFTVFIYWHGQYSYRQQNPQHRKNVWSSVHKSLTKLNKQRCLLLKKRQNIQENVSKSTHIDEAIELLHHMKHFRQSLTNIFVRRNPVVMTASLSLSSCDFRRPLFYSEPGIRQSVKRISIVVDRMLFITYLISLPLSILFLYKSAHQAHLTSLAKTNSTNQLLDLRKSSIDPKPLFCGCDN